MSGSRHADAWDSPGFLLWHATLRWQRAMAEALAPYDVTHVQFVLLASTWWLCEHDGAPRQRDLAEHAGTDPMMTSQVVRALVAKGLLVREVDADDARAWRVRPTAAGTALARRAVAAVEAADAAYFDQVPARSRAGMLAALTELGGRRG
ncbi:MAG TPA: MarR family winged helix-turn-helix transcriptional regulator [Candidatus Nanopelagicales bacterium]|nr:MarR family winged helix-turn-helix transcriptional regulator [Candidatus Nanopelagicales bacterium]